MFQDMMDSIGFLGTKDAELAEAMQAELQRQRENIELIASENIVSPAVMAAMGSVLTNKYAEGYPGHRYYGGCQHVDVVEQLAIDRACELFGAKYANVQPHSGAQANLAVYFAVLEVGDTVMGMDLSQGGHLTHGSPANMSGKYYNFIAYGVNENGFLDYDALEKQVKEVQPKLLVAGASAYCRALNFERLANIAHGVGAMLMVDMAHIAGLVAGGAHMNMSFKFLYTPGSEYFHIADKGLFGAEICPGKGAVGAQANLGENLAELAGNGDSRERQGLFSVMIIGKAHFAAYIVAVKIHLQAGHGENSKSGG